MTEQEVSVDKFLELIQTAPAWNLSKDWAGWVLVVATPRETPFPSDIKTYRHVGLLSTMTDDEYMKLHEGLQEFLNSRGAVEAFLEKELSWTLTKTESSTMDMWRPSSGFIANCVL